MTALVLHRKYKENMRRAVDSIGYPGFFYSKVLTWTGMGSYKNPASYKQHAKFSRSIFSTSKPIKINVREQ